MRFGKAVCGGRLKAQVSFGGMAVPILLWVIYFAVNGALGDAVTAYLTNNIFLYGDGALTLTEHVKKNRAVYAAKCALGHSGGCGHGHTPV